MPIPRHALPRTAATAVLVLMLSFCSDPAANGPLPPGENPPPGDAPPPADPPPEAAFTSSCTDLSCTFADGSTDPQGTIMSRSWVFGDGSPAAAVASHTYAAEGTYPVTLTVTDDAGGNGSVTHDVSVSNHVANRSPTAQFVAACSVLSCTFTDASTDPDGTIASRSWSFGDGAGSSGVNPGHTYAAAGTYSVGLTVTDNAGATGSRSESVTLQGPDPILIGAGDIAGCTTGFMDRETAAIVAQYPTATVLTLGDNTYPDGSATSYSQCYARSWGAFKDRTRPAPGNHDYQTAGAMGYFGYFGTSAGPAGRGYYSYDLGSWHIISLNSEVDASGTSAQANWLRQDLAAHPATCTLAYWHKPLFTSAIAHTPELTMQALFTILYDAGADVLLSGHNHQYERFAPQRVDKTRDDAQGIREFVVGTGGVGLYDFGTPQPNSVVRYQGWGVMKLTLKAATYTWEFLPIAGSTFTDSGTGACH